MPQQVPMSTRCGWGLPAALLLLFGGCTDARPGPGAQAGAARAPQDSLGHAGREPAPEAARLRQSYIAARQSEGAGDARYHFAASEAGRDVSAANPAQGLRASFDGATLRVAPELPADWSFSLTTRAAGCEGQLTPLGEGSAGWSGSKHRVEARRTLRGATALVEWYVNGPLGIEQGFTFDQSPCSAQAVELAIELQAEGLTPHLSEGEIRLRDATGKLVAGYSDLFAIDASGRHLPARFEAVGEQWRLLVGIVDAVWPVTVDPLVWGQWRTIVSPETTSYRFGLNLALDGDTALMGSPYHDDYTGAAYVFIRSGTQWTQQAKLVAPDGAAYDRFGEGVALANDTAIVGAQGAHNASAVRSGAAYVFVRSGTTWSFQQKLAPADGETSDGFGGKIAVDADTAVFGMASDDDQGQMSGSAYVYTRSGSTWTLQQKLLQGDGGAGDYFGSAVAVEGDTALIAAQYDDELAYRVGGVLVYTRTNNTWSFRTKLKPSEFTTDDAFGWAIDLDANDALISAFGKGTAYVFVGAGNSWSIQQQLTFPGGGQSDNFGASVSISNGVAVIGRPNHDANGTRSGAAYVYTRGGTVWGAGVELVIPGSSTQEVGQATALSGDTLLLGSYGNSDKGAVYAGRLAPENGSSCVTDDDCASLHCVENVCCDTACSEPCRSCLASRKQSGPDGVCGLVDEGTDPRDSCAQANVVTCQQSGVCTSTGSCALYEQGTVCVPASCPTPTSENVADICSFGSCIEYGTNQCLSGYRCVAGACKTSCTTEADCADGFSCFAGQCKIPQGEPCSLDSDCITDSCADGVCCDTNCGNECEACIEELTGMPDGQCVAFPADQDPASECPEDPNYPESCGRDGSCDGQSACRRFAKAGVPCTDNPTTCVNDQISGQLCNGAGQCVGDTLPCAPYICAGDVCSTACEDDSGCDVGDGYCLPGGTCASKDADGTACTEARTCLSGNCVDGVCCESECTRQCAACAEPGREGQCVAVEGLPRGDRPACAGDPAVCGGACDGVDDVQCSYAPSTKVCARSCESSEQTISNCDGSGECVAGPAMSCGDYVCGTDRCMTSCASDADCQPSHSCSSSNRCTPRTTSCSDDGRSSISHEGEVVSCGAYLCEPSSGECATSCTSSATCASGFVCDDNDNCVSKQSGAESEAGCGCRQAGSPASNRFSASLVALALLAGWSRRRAALVRGGSAR